MTKDKENFHKYNSWMKKAFNFKLNIKEYKMFNNYYKKNYLKYLNKNKQISILEIGCWMWHFWYFLKNEWYDNYFWIDLDKNNIEQCKIIWLNNVIVEDMFVYLDKINNDSIDIVVMNDIIEHIDWNVIVSFLKLIKTKLIKDWKVIIKTCNCNNIYWLSSFFSDFTHLVWYTSWKLQHVWMLAWYNKVENFNLYLYFNIPVIDYIFNLPFYIIYKIKYLQFLINWRTWQKVFSKNILSIFYK